MDLEQHWNRIYTEKSAQGLSWYQQNPSVSLQLIQQCELSLDDYILDVGGGASVLVDKLLAAGYRHLLVLDISERALQFAQQRLGTRATQVSWLHSDITGFIPSVPVELWHDRAVFHFLLQASEREAYIQVLNQTLKSGGYVIIAAFAIGGPTQCSGLDIVQYDAKTLMQQFGDGYQLLDEHNEMHLTPNNTIQAFTYYRLLKR